MKSMDLIQVWNKQTLCLWHTLKYSCIHPGKRRAIYARELMKTHAMRICSFHPLNTHPSTSVLCHPTTTTTSLFLWLYVCSLYSHIYKYAKLYQEEYIYTCIVIYMYTLPYICEHTYILIYITLHRRMKITYICI